MAFGCQYAATVTTGQQERIPLRFALPANLAPGNYALTMTMKPSLGEPQTDRDRHQLYIYSAFSVGCMMILFKRMYIPPLMEALGLAEVEHNAKNNRMRAV